MRHLVARAAHSAPRPLAKAAYDGIIAAELAIVRAFDLGNASDLAGSDLLRELTAVVKTFERPRVVLRLVRSIRRRYPDLRVIVVDDSREPTPMPGVETIVMPYDSGLSAGRQRALEEVKTKYFLLLDDDHVFYRHTLLERTLALMEACPEIDILGGDEVLLPLFAPSEFWRGEVYDSGPATRERGSTIGNLVVCDRVPNFFLSRTERLRLVGWEPALRTLDHIDFFTRAKGVLTTVYDPDFRVLHARTPLDTLYMERRLDTESALAVLRQRYGDAVTPTGDL